MDHAVTEHSPVKKPLQAAFSQPSTAHLLEAVLWWGSQKSEAMMSSVS